MGAFRQFYLMLWKNWLISRRKIAATAFEIILPILFSLILLAIRAISTTTNHTEMSTWNSFSVGNISNVIPIGKDKLLFYPNHTKIIEIMSSVTTDISDSVTVTGYSSVSDILTLVERSKASVWAAVVFDDADYSTTLPNAIRYSLRVAFSDSEKEWFTEYNYPFFRTSGYRNNDSDGGEPGYGTSGFLALQYAIDKAIIDIQLPSNNMSGIAISLQRMAYPPFVADGALDSLRTSLPLLLILTFIVTVFQTTKNIAQEKESRIKESMKLMGLRPAVYWLSWFAKVFIYMFVTCLFFTLMFAIKIGDASILNNSSPVLIFFFLLFFGISIICFCFLMSTIFHTANSASYAAAILYFLTYIPFTFLESRYGDMTASQKLASCLLNNVAMSFGILTIALYEATGDGANFTNFASPATQDDNFSLLQAILMMIGDSLIYLTFAWYLENVRPGHHGIPKPWYFPFTKSYWCGRQVSDELIDLDERVNQDTFEPDPIDLPIGINISHLRKEFGRGKNKKVAVADTSLNMYEGQITALLGHNGAGKTTTMSMLTGFIPPTKGTAVINGCDVRINLEGVRKSLGLCPQHNILFDLLTVEEHLELFAKLKDVPSAEVQGQVDAMLNILRLQGKRKTYSHALSGGQKRKLSVGIALMGDSKVIILDEPTSGMDPAARRETWDILQTYREGRTVVLTTHFMDEADLLGDRIAIMADGVVKCCGTSHFLKQKYGAGYHLVIVKTQSCDVSRVTNLIQSHISTAVLESNISAELSYILPFDESSKFEQLFNEIETKATELGISSFGTTATTMEEVFLKVGEGAKNEDEEEDENDEDVFESQDKKVHVNSDHGNSDLRPANLYHGDKPAPSVAFDEKTSNGLGKEILPPIEYYTKNVLEMKPVNSTVNDQSDASRSSVSKNKGLHLSVQQFYGMFVKKFIHTKRNRVVTIVQLSLPVIFTILALLVAELAPSQLDEPALALTLAPFKKAQVVTYSSGKAASTTFTDNVASIYTGIVSAYETENFDTLSYSTLNNFFVAKAESIGISTFSNKYVIAADFGSNSEFTAYFNGEAYHSPAITLAYMMTTMLQVYKGSGYSITTVNHPLPLTLAEKSQSDEASGTGFSVAFFVIFGMSFLTTSFVIFLVKERHTGAKHLQKVSGVSSIVYWLSNYCWDFINYHIPVFLILIVFAAYQTPAYVYDNRLGIVFLLFLLYGFCCLPFVYCFQFLFSVPATAMVTITMLNIITGLASLLTVFLLDVFNSSKAHDIVDWVCTILMPHYCLGQGLNKMFVNYNNIKTCNTANFELLCSIDNTLSCCSGCTSKCIDYQTNYMAWSNPGILKYLIFLLLQTVVFFCFVLAIEYGLIEKLRYSLSKKTEHTATVAAADEEQLIDDVNEDSDVSDERRRINETDLKSLMDTDALIIKNLAKSYGRYRAVKGINIGVAQQECFGLLGQNGAGKTTTFKMLTGDVIVSRGNAYLNSFDVKQHLKEVQQNVGYCPQFDALIDQMTGRETLYMYARLRGVTENQIPDLVDNLVKITMLTKYADKNCSNYSGGNKRKLSTAIALIGDPPFILLDEPTTGMDPAARRKLWNVLSDVRASGRTLILTSHSMEECDALCTKIVIMVNGKFVCLGSPQHLKSKFGQGYTLILRLGTDSARVPLPSGPVKSFVKETFPNSEIFEDHQGYVHFQIPDTNVPLGKIFSAMENAKSQLDIEDYAVHQTTLEQVFLTFTRNQTQPRETKKGFCCGLC